MGRLRWARLSSASPREAGTSRFALALDFLSDFGVLAFATWTLFAYAGMATQARVSILVPLWLATLVPLTAAFVMLSRRSARATAIPAPADTETRPPSRNGHAEKRLYLVGAGIAGGILSAVLVGAEADVPWPLVWLGLVAAVVVALGRLRSETPRAAGPVPSWIAHAVAALTGVGFAIMSLFINRPNGDDAFYVNRATGVAELNRIPTRDTIFTNEQVDAVGGSTGLPVDSFSALQGALAHFLGIHGASVAYYLTPPLFTFLATWALWRLVRSWAPRRIFICFAVGCVYWLFSAQADLTAGGYFIGRMWQGKVIFVAWLVPTMYVLLTRWLGRREKTVSVLLVACGIASVGMTGSAAFVAPLIFGAAVLALTATRDWRGLPPVLVAGAVPLLVGVTVAAAYPLIEGYAVDQLYPTPPIETWWYFDEVFGLGPVAALGLTALWAGPWLARSGPPARLLCAIAVVATVLLAPGVLPGLNELTDLTSVLRRTLWVVPFPALVALLGAVPAGLLLGRTARASLLRRGLVAVSPLVLVAALMPVFGQPLWIPWRTGEPAWQSRPTWKVNQQALATAEAILRDYHGDGQILAHPATMQVLGIITVNPKPVNARDLYARFLPEPRRITRDRLLLTALVAGQDPPPPRSAVGRALSDLDVGLVCVAAWRTRLIRQIEAAGTFREVFRVPTQSDPDDSRPDGTHTLACLQGSSSGSSS